MPGRRLYYRILPFFPLFCLSLSHAQTSPEAVLNNTLESVQPVTPAPVTTAPAAPAPAPGAAPPASGMPSLGEQAATSGRYEEYQSICRINEYDQIKDFSDALKQKRVDLLKKRISAAKADDKPKMTLRLIKEYLDQQRDDEAKKLIGELKAQKLSSFDNEFLNSFLAIAGNNLVLARETLNKILQTDGNKDNVEILRNLADVYMAEQNYYEAGTIYEDLNKTTKNAYLPQLCEALVLNTMNADGEKACLRAATAFPTNPFPDIFTGITYRERQDLIKALEFFKKSQKIKPTEMAIVCTAEIYFMDKKFSEAATEFRKALIFNPDSTRAMLGLAWARLKLKEYPQSLEAFKNACKVNSKYEVELRKAFKTLSAEKVPEAPQFIKATDSCGQYPERLTQ